MDVPIDILTAGLGATCLLVGVVYANLSDRISKTEKAKDEMLPKLIEIGADVKHIRENCPKCK